MSFVGARVPPSPFNIEFEYWSDLAQRDPPGFFAARQRLIEDFIEAAPSRHRADLRHLQALVDASRVQAGTPANAVRELMRMMCDRLEVLQDQLILLRAEAQHVSDDLARLAE